MDTRQHFTCIGHADLFAACRAVIFASMVDDPSECKDEFPTESDQNAERNRLHGIIKRLVIWKTCNDENLLAEAAL